MKAMAVLVGSLMMGSATAQELVVDGAFDDYGEGGMAKGWVDNSSWADLDVSYAKEPDGAHSGEACLLVNCTRLGDGAVQVTPSKRTPLEKGAIYRVSGWVKGERGQAALQLRHAPSPYTVYVESHAWLTPEWQEVNYIWTSTVDDTSGLFMVRLTNVGKVWLDDISVAKVTPDEARAAAGKPRPGNLLRNGSFDLGAANWLINHGCDYWDEATLTVEETDGQPVLRLEVPDGVSVALSSDAAEVGPGHPLKMSWRLRADREVEPLLNAANIWRREKVGEEWTTIAAEGAAPFAPQPTAHATLTVTGPVTLWFDEVRVEQAEGQDAPIAAAISDRHPMSLYHEGETPRLRLMSTGGETEFRWSVTNYFGEAVAGGSWQGRAERQEETVKLEGSERGWYHVRVVWEHDGEELLNESTFCVLPPPERSSDIHASPFGAHFAIDETSLALAKAVGVRWLRLHPPNHTKWRVVEPEQGQWAWRDAAIRKAREAGLELVGSLDRLPKWASSAPEDMEQRGFYFGPTAWPPRDWSEWETYVAETVRHHREDIRIWEVWNEPNLTDWLVPPEGQTRPEVYAEMLEHTYPVVKREDPEAEVWGACIAGAITDGSSAQEFADGIIALGALANMDVLSFHQYISHSIDEQGDPIDTWTPRLRERMREAGKLVPLVNSEGGFSEPGSSITYRPGGAGHVPADIMAKLLVRQHVAQLAAGVERFFFYNFFIDGSPVVKTWEGFLEGDGQPLPNVAAYATMTWLLDGATYTKTDRPSEDVWIHHFDSPDGPLAVAWTRTGTTEKRRFRGAKAAWDLMGGEVKVPGGKRLELTDAPIYVRLSK